MKRAIAVALLAFALCAGIGCGGSQAGTQSSPVQPTLAGISISSTDQNSLPIGETAQLAATATYNNKSTENVSGTAAWSSSNPAVATVSSSGTVTAVAVGTATISASVSGVSGGALISVVAAVLQSIAVSPAAPAIIMGKTQQFGATGRYSDGSTADLSATAQWSFSNNAIATVSPTGLATGQSAGSGTVSAALSGITGTTTLTVNPKALTSINVMPGGLTIYLGGTQQFEAVGSYNDGSAGDITSSVTWASSAPNSASVSTGALVSALAAGSTTISASNGSIWGAGSLTVSATNSGFTLVNDMTDSRLLLFRDTDGSVAQFNGTRTDTGSLNAITSTKISHPDGTSETVLYDDQEQPIDFQLSDGSEFAITWPSDTSSSPIVTAYSSDHTLVLSAPFTLPTSSGDGSSVVPSKLKRSSPFARKAQSTSSTDDPSLVTVNVTSYDQLPESAASVEVSESGTFLGGSITAVPTQPGIYQANLPTGSSIEAVTDAIQSAAETVELPCDVLEAAEGKSTINTPNGLLTSAICTGLTVASDFDSLGFLVPTSLAVLKSCTATLETGIAILDNVCKVTTADKIAQYFSPETTAVVNFFNSLSKDVTATAVLNQDLESATNKGQPAVGPFDAFNLRVGVVPVAKVSVLPSTLSLPLGASAPLSAEALDANSYALKSSTFQWSWMSDNNSVASVPGTGILIPAGSLLSTGVASVTAQSPGSANITATENTTGTSGTSMITATGPEVTGLWLGTYTWNPPNGETVNFGIFIGGQGGTSFTAGLGFGYPSGVEPYCAEGQDGGLNPAEFYVCGAAGQITGNQFTITYPAGATSATLVYQITATISGNTMTGTICNYNNPNYEPALCGNMTLTYDPYWLDLESRHAEGASPNVVRNLKDF